MHHADIRGTCRASFHRCCEVMRGATFLLQPERYLGSLFRLISPTCFGLPSFAEPHLT